MSATIRASVVVSNHDYGRFLREAVDSALGQSHTDTEVIVVDDGSSDDSEQIIRSYGDAVVPVFKENGGQASAFNAGFERARGDVVFFLDADDVLLPDAVEAAVEAFAHDSAIVKTQWPLWVIDAEGRRTGEVKAADLPAGDLRDAVLRDGPASALPSAPTSGTAWARGFLERVMPVPEDSFRLCSDAYLFTLAPALGPIATLAEPHGLFRLHGDNGYQGRPFEEKVALGARQEEQQYECLRRVLADMGVAADVERWSARSWWPRLERAVDDLRRAIPEGEPFVLADEDNWGVGETLCGRPRLPFPARDGVYWGPPQDDEEAVTELERRRAAGVRFLAFGWPAFWWLDHYTGLHDRLKATADKVTDSDRVMVFRLDTE